MKHLKRFNESIISYDDSFLSVLEIIESLSKEEFDSVNTITRNPNKVEGIEGGVSAIVNDFKSIMNQDVDTDIVSLAIPEGADAGTVEFTTERGLPQLIKIGRLVNKLFPGKYEPIQIESFVYNFNFAVEKLNNPSAVPTANSWLNENPKDNRRDIDEHGNDWYGFDHPEDLGESLKHLKKFESFTRK